MNDPERWLDDGDTAPELRELLSAAPRASALDQATRSRLGVRVGRVAALPVSLFTWLSVKSAAALGVTAGLLSAGASVAIVEYASEPTAPASVQSATVRPLVRGHREPRAAVSAPPTLAPGAASVPLPSTVDPAPPHRVVASPSASANDLEQESLLLERARRALASAPAEALSRVREHRARFPRAALISERNLIELEALYRLGRRDEARALAERLLKAGGDDLYTGRIRKLLSKIDEGR